MFVLGIDPGLSRCGYGCVERTPGGSRAVAMGVLSTPPGDPLPTRLAALQDDLAALVAELRPSVVAVERVFFQVNAKTAMQVAQASGLALAAAARAGCEVVQYTPNEVKQTVTGSGSADKRQVERMVRTLLGLPDVRHHADTFDALALALCHLAVSPMRARVALATGANR